MRTRRFPRKKKELARANGQDTILMVLNWKPQGRLSRLLWSITGPKFGQGKSTSISCALARPYRQLIEEGKPIGRINYVFFRIGGQPSHILGTLCFTPGKRLLFYPGLIERKANWSFSKNTFQSIKSTGFVDHITIEPGFRSWHMTILEPDGTKKSHLRSLKTKMIKDDIVFWFGLTIQGPHILETTPEELSMTFSSPPQDSDRRAKLLIDARKDAIFHLTTLDHMNLNIGEFLHFDFFIGPSTLSTEELPCFVPIHKPIVDGYAQAFKEGTHLRFHPVALEGIPQKIWVVVSKHIGHPSDRAIFTCP